MVHIQNPIEKKKIFESIQVDSDSWLVADLKVKFDFQTALLRTAQGFEDTTVYRLSELWRYLYKQYLWTYEILSPDLARILISQFLAEKEADIFKSPRAAELTFQCLQEFASLYADSKDLQLIETWFSENPDSLRWYGWFEVAREIFVRLKEKNLILASWIPYLLIDVDKPLHFPKKRIFLDVGIHLAAIEAQVLIKIAQDSQIELVILRPSDEGIEQRFAFPLQVYNEFKSVQSFKEIRRPSKESQVLPARTYKVSNPVAEIRFAANQILDWQNRAVPLEDIALIAPDIESYWPVVSGIFKEALVPIQKVNVARPVSFLQVDRWVAEAKVHVRNFSYANLEQAYFSKTIQKMPFEKFFALYSSLIDAEDLAREDEVAELFSKAWTEVNFWTAEEFAVNLLSLDSFPENFSVEPILRELLSLRQDVQLSPQDWMKYLTSVLATSEVSIETGACSGVKFLNMASAEATSLTHKIYIGLTESQVEKRSFSLISQSEIQDLTNLGFLLPSPECNHIDFDLRWSSLIPVAEQIFLFPETDFLGGVQRSCSYWVELEKKWGLQPLPADSLENPAVADTPKSTPLKEIKQNQFFGFDLNEAHLSASSLEDYLNCPFVFAAKKVFKLLDEPLVDLQADPRSLGSLDHAILEKLSPVADLRDYSDTDLLALFDEIKSHLNLKFFDKSVWDLIKIRKLKMARRFLKVEHQLRSQIPNLKPLARELSFEVDIEGMKFKGKIDRVDQLDGQDVCIFDYKSGTSGLSSFKSWVEKDQLQMLIYAEALKKQGYRVVSAEYFDLRKMKALKGFRISDILWTEDLSASPRVSEDELEQHLCSLREKIKDVAKKMAQGQFAPSPKNQDECVNCEWRTLCRAPHLN